MADLSNNSFIPKQGPTKQKRSATSRPVYVFTIISYILMFATLISTAGVYFYSRYINSQLEAEIASLNSAISGFSESDMQRVLEFDRRLQQAKNRLDNSVSMVSIFDALESATINSVKVESLDLVREEDTNYLLSATINTDGFDSTIFQRGVYQRNSTIGSVDIQSVQSVTGEESATAAAAKTTFVAELNIPIDSIPYTGVPTVTNEPVLIINQDSTQAEETLSEEVGTTSEEVGLEPELEDNQDSL